MSFRPIASSFVSASLEVVLDLILCDDRFDVLLGGDVLIVSAGHTRTEFNFGQFFDGDRDGRDYKACRQAIALLNEALAY